MALLNKWMKQYNSGKNSQQAGFAAEASARDYLISQGLCWVASNYRSRAGEIDLIMQDKKYLVFVEVRARTSAKFGSALESVTWQKRQKIIKTALHYMTSNNLYNKYSCRFDVVSIQGACQEMAWVKNAFGLDF